MPPSRTSAEAYLTGWPNAQSLERFVTFGLFALGNDMFACSTHGRQQSLLRQPYVHTVEP